MTSPDYAHHFSSRNIPFGIASSKAHPEPQVVTRIQNTVLFLSDVHFDSLSLGDAKDVFLKPSLNPLMELPGSVHTTIRDSIRVRFDKGGFGAFPELSMEGIEHVEMHLPIQVGDFIDFSCSLEHVQNAGRIVINDATPPPGFFHFPIGYHGRASSVVVSGTDIERPIGQYRSSFGDGAVVTASSGQVDYELEFAAVVGRSLARDKRLNATDADEHIFGFVLLNDWSARDIQALEMKPLGPLNGKAFGTTISPWVIAKEALAPFTTPGPPRKIPVARYLADPDNTTYRVHLKAEIISAGKPTLVGAAGVQGMYWTARQMLAHAASSGAALRTGDLLATGTVSGEGDGGKGCLLEMTEGGRVPVRLESGGERRYLEDGDVVRLSGFVGEEGSGVGFGECVGRLVPSRPLDGW